VPQASSPASGQATPTAGHLRRFVDFAEPRRDDTCLDLAPSGLAGHLRPRVREVTTATAGSLPSGRYTLVTARLALARTRKDDQVTLVRDLLRVCGGRLVLADLVRTRAGDGDRLERLRDPAYVAMRTFPELLGVLWKAGGWTRRLDVFTIERPVEPWLADARDPERIRQELDDELDGGPRTGARPRLIGDELWFTQSWAYFAVEPVEPVGQGPALERTRPFSLRRGRAPRRR
jgi:hypothetical protein